jgi:hypothetical protein
MDFLAMGLMPLLFLHTRKGLGIWINMNHMWTQEVLEVYITVILRLATCMKQCDIMGMMAERAGKIIFSVETACSMIIDSLGLHL